MVWTEHHPDSSLTFVACEHGGQVTVVTTCGTAARGNTNTAFVAGMTEGSMVSQLFTLNLEIGAATLVGNIGVTGGIEGLALTAVPVPSSYALMVSGLLALGAVSGRARRKAGR